MPRRTKATILIVLLVLVLLGLAAYLHRKAPPEVARLLPEADCILYFNPRPLRAATHFDRNHTEEDGGRTIYHTPSQGGTVRVAFLGYDMVAASNTPTTEQIHSMLDR